MSHLTTMTTSSLFFFYKKGTHNLSAYRRTKDMWCITVVSGLTGRLSCIGVPPSLTILAFFLCSRLSWFFFIRAISSSSLVLKVNIKCSLVWKRKYLFLARLSLSASPVGANESAKVASSSRAWRPRTYALITAGSRMISVCQSPSTLFNSAFPVSGNNTS